MDGPTDETMDVNQTDSTSMVGLRERIVASRKFGNFLEDRLLTR